MNTIIITKWLISSYIRISVADPGFGCGESKFIVPLS